MFILMLSEYYLFFLHIPFFPMVTDAKNQLARRRDLRYVHMETVDIYACKWLVDYLDCVGVSFKLLFVICRKIVVLLTAKGHWLDGLVLESGK